MRNSRYSAGQPRRGNSAGRSSYDERQRRAPQDTGARIGRIVAAPIPWRSVAERRKRMPARLTIAAVGIVIIALALVVRLAVVQLWWGDRLALDAQMQRGRTDVEYARRGTITDRSGEELAFSLQSRALSISPRLLRPEIAERARFALRQARAEQGSSAPVTDEEITAETRRRMEEMAREIPRMLQKSQARGLAAEVPRDEKTLWEKLNADTTYELVARYVDPDVANEIVARFPGVAADLEPTRYYPNGAIAKNVLGRVSMDGRGQFGFEQSAEDLLSGTNGVLSADYSLNGKPIPGSLRERVAAENGNNIALTLDVNLQTYVQQQLEQSMKNSRAKVGEVVVLDAKTGEVLAMANAGTVNPNENVDEQLAGGKTFDNPSVSTPYEPGSVAKIITAAAALEEKLITPDEVFQVPGAISTDGVTVSDAWMHDVAPYTATGIFGKSSNVGTLMIADRLGRERFADYLNRFGIGKVTNIELPDESPGLLAPVDKWQGGAFANLPIGQGMSWTTLQMASVYQALANGGVRIEPRIIDKVSTSDGEEQPVPQGKHERVVSEQTARTVVDMFRATVQSDPSGVQQGIAPSGQVPGYQVSGKTGTAQKVDPNTGAYSLSQHWITFGGIAPADDPRFVISIMLDEPQRSSDGTGGQSAAPLFREIASWLLNRDNIPPSPPAEPLVLQATNYTTKDD